MARIETTTRIAAPRERCFDLARSVDDTRGRRPGSLRRFLDARNAELKRIAESDEWRRYLP
jgi:hypothetical protein